MSSQNTILRFSSEDLWFTSDTHFGCDNIIRFCGRPFKSAAEMDEELICRWNDTVPEDGIIFHLGDFCQGSKKEWESILKRLHGHKYLILGNASSFQIALDMTVSGRRYLFSHAGVRYGWLLCHKDILGDHPVKDPATRLNGLWWNEQSRLALLSALADIPYSRWGRCLYGSPVWSDVEDMDDTGFEIPDTFQIFGHTQQEFEPVIGQHYACLDVRKAFRLTEDGAFKAI